MTVLLGYEVGAGEPVEIPLRHMAVTGQTQESGKTTTLEGLVSRAGVTALAFVTKRGERAFADGHRVQPYFRDRADWLFVTSIIDATLQEKNKFLRPWIMKVCRTTRTLADVQRAVRAALATAKGINEGVYTQLDAYLDLIVPEIERTALAPTLDLNRGINVMDVSASPTPMQMLFVQSALDWINEHAHNTVVIIPEAWEFIPEGKGSPVKKSAIDLVRKGAGLGNYIWVDSQDMAGVDKTILRGCAVWLIGVQREANEIKRNLSNIPQSIKRPSAAAVATLERGQFYAAWSNHLVKTYVRPAWMPDEEAQAHARGESVAKRSKPPIWIPPDARPVSKPATQPIEEKTVNETEARALREDNARLRKRIDELENREYRPRAVVEDEPATTLTVSGKEPAPDTFDMDWVFAEFKKRLIAEAPSLIRVLATKPTIDVEIKRERVTIDGSSPKGRIARLLANGWFDGEGKTNSATRTELKRTGTDVSNASISNIFNSLVKDGFLTEESGSRYRAVEDMKVNLVEL